MLGGAFLSSPGGTTVASGGTIPLGSAQSRYGCGVSGSGSSIRLSGGCGGTWWLVTGTVALTAAEAGTAAVTLIAGGDAVTSSAATVAAGSTVTLPVSAIVRAGCDGRVLSLTLSGVSGTIGQTSLAVARVA